MSETTALPTWAEQMRALEPVGENLMARWRPDGATEAEVQDMNKLALSMLAAGYLCRVYTEPTQPVFTPLWNYAFNQGGPDPDYVYSAVEVDAAGVYRLSGFRGTSRFVDLSQMGSLMMGVDVEGAPSARLTITHDLDDLDIDGSGHFSVVLSAERPAGHEGDWWQLDPQARRLLMRRCSCDWIGEIDARVAIERLDGRGHDMTPQEIAHRMSDMAAWIEGMITFDMDLVRYYREHHGINTFLRSTKIVSLGGLPQQAYYDGIHEITDDEALIIETDLPEECRYWQALVADDRFCTVDWVNRQSSINDTQAHIDGDGRFRAVICTRDPGVPNWLDKADIPWGIIQMRWNRASDHPDPTMKKVPFDKVRQHLPEDTPVVGPEERARSLSRRRQGAQFRRIW
jgi:hypothetical protein